MPFTSGQFYPALLERYMKQHEGTDISAMPVHSGMLEIPIEIGSMAAGKRIHAISWPDSTSVITIRRGEQEFVPRHDSMLRAGDAIVVIFSGKMSAACADHYQKYVRCRKTGTDFNLLFLSSIAVLQYSLQGGRISLGLPKIG